MGDVVEFENPNGDLPHPLWFYKSCGDVVRHLCELFSEKLNAADITEDHIFEAAMEIPPRLIALMEGDDEITKFVEMAVMDMSYQFKAKEDAKYGRTRGGGV